MDDAQKAEYRAARNKEIEAENKILDAVAEAVKGSKWEVPNGVMTEVLVVMTSVDDDGDYCTVWVNKGSWCTAEGMARRVLRDVDARHQMGIASDDD
jgi:hypothetical protein